MDNYFRPFDQLRVNELMVNRIGYFRPSYELNDGQFIYAKLSTAGWFKPTAILETADNRWELVPKGLFRRTLYINKSATENIGSVKPEAWTRKISLGMNDGFQAHFTSKKVFSRTVYLNSDQYGDMFSIEPNLWKFKMPFRVTFNRDILKQVPEIGMYMLIGIYMVLLRQQQAAAAH
ncbi:hypothetical protein HQ865_12365 [Mucilaginibacter mali]|uniref:Uncharacterized protein n=1 Tax=Mucilaginibacter mali TaxID=2740462 RepID=A0A7D4TVF3_9SPHI|nr:hypothetical protein [Mucilaginibacter mali]QKJ30515.1 hypothetical protein HQ865_12365 [Mucilaginibacter mali]